MFDLHGVHLKKCNYSPSISAFHSLHIFSELIPFCWHYTMQWQVDKQHSYQARAAWSAEEKHHTEGKVNLRLYCREKLNEAFKSTETSSSAKSNPPFVEAQLGLLWFFTLKLGLQGLQVCCHTVINAFIYCILDFSLVHISHGTE